MRELGEGRLRRRRPDGLRTRRAEVFWRTRGDDMGVKVVRQLLRRNPELLPERIGDVIMAATAQFGDQGLTLGRDVALLAGLPQGVPGFAVDRICDSSGPRSAMA